MPDPSRVAARVVSGIGFLGAGSILLRGEIIRGLTTAASLWSVAATGPAAGGDLCTAAIAATVIILAGLKPIERRFFEERRRHMPRLHARRGALEFGALSRELGAAASASSCRRAPGTGRWTT